jgi:hypothetical protein
VINFAHQTWTRQQRRLTNVKGWDPDSPHVFLSNLESGCLGHRSAPLGVALPQLGSASILIVEQRGPGAIIPREEAPPLCNKRGQQRKQSQSKIETEPRPCHPSTTKSGMNPLFGNCRSSTNSSYSGKIGSDYSARWPIPGVGRVA